MSVSINLYKVAKAEKIDELNDLTTELRNAHPSKIDLYKFTEDLAIIFLNNVDPFDDTESLPYKMLFGNGNPMLFEYPEIGGFLSTSEVLQVSNWLKQNNIATFEGFSKLYDHLSEEVKNQLVDIGSPTKEELFNGFVKPLSEFYSAAEKGHNSVLVCGE